MSVATDLSYNQSLVENYLSLPQPVTSIKINVKIFTISTYKLNAAKMYSSGDIPYLWLPLTMTCVL